MTAPYVADAIRARIASTFQAVVWGPSFTGFGYRPDFTPFHQDDLLTGIIAGIGGVDLASPIICVRRMKPVSGREFIADCSYSFKTSAI